MADKNVFLRPATESARKAINRAEVAIDRWPFRVGRESRVGVVHGHFGGLEQRRLERPHTNDLYIQDRSRELHVSRAHFQVEQDAHGGYEIVDCGSTCGLVVDNDRVGGHGRGGRHALRNESRIVVGRADSPFIFEFGIAPE